MEIHLITPDGQDYNLSHTTTAYLSFLDQLPGGVGYPQISHLYTESPYRHGGWLRRLRYQPRIVDIVVTTYGDTVADLLTSLSRIYTAAKPDATGLVPSTLKVVEGSRTAYLDVYYMGETVRQSNAGRGAELTLRFVAYNPQWYSTESQVILPYAASFVSSYIARRMSSGVTTGSVWDSFGGGMNDTVLSLAVAPDGTLYAGGYFTTAGGVAANRVAKWTGSSWQALGSGMNNPVRSLAVAPDGTLYAGGDFTTAGGVAANYVAKWTGSSWQALGSGVNNSVYALTVAPDGTLYAGGDFTIAGGVTVNDRVAQWNGSRWVSLDIDLHAMAYTTSICASPLVIGTSTSGTATSAEATTVTNSGSSVKPRLIVTGPGTLQSICNETTGARLWFNVALLAGETLTIDCDNLTITSNWRGNMLSGLIPGSNFGGFYLVSGDNVISTLILDGGAGTSAVIKWTTQYDTLAEALG